MRIHRLFCCIGISSCAALPDDARHVLTRDSSGVRITVIASSAQPATWHLSSSPLVELGSEDPGGILYRIRGAVRLNNGEYVVANGGYDELRWYDAAGRFVRRAGREGRGPGEFMSLNWVGRHEGDTIVAWDTRTQRVSLFTGDGQFTAMVPVPIRGTIHGKFSDGSLLMGETHRSGLGFGRSQITLWRLFPTTGVVDSLGTYPGDEQIVTQRETSRGLRFSTRSPPFAREGAFAAREQRMMVSNQQDYEIREYATDGSLAAILRLMRSITPVTVEDIETYRRVTLENYWRRDVAEMRRRLEEQPYPDVFPAHGPVMVDQLDNLWVQEYRKPWETAADWLVFDRTDRLVGAVSTPANLEIFEIGSDYVLGMWRDDSYVEHVGVFGVVKP